MQIELKAILFQNDIEIAKENLIDIKTIGSYTYLLDSHSDNIRKFIGILGIMDMNIKVIDYED